MFLSLSELQDEEKKNSVNSSDCSKVIPQPMPETGVLQFWTESAFFHISQSNIEVPHAHNEPFEHDTTIRRFKRLDAKDKWVGLVQMPQRWDCIGRKWEFIILSANMSIARDNDGGLLHQMLRDRVLKGKWDALGQGATNVAVYFYDVLMIEWRRGIAYRLGVGLGCVYFADWDSAGPMDKLITLG